MRSSIASRVKSSKLTAGRGRWSTQARVVGRKRTGSVRRTYRDSATCRQLAWRTPSAAAWTSRPSVSAARVAVLRSCSRPAAARPPAAAALAIKLSETHRLQLDDRLSDYLPRWPNASRITIRQLLNHTSGVSSFDTELGDPLNRAIDAKPRSFWSPRRTLSYARKPSFEPGARWQYNNANYLLAGLVIERATNTTVADALRQQILDPLKLDDVVLQPPERARGPTAHGYGKIGNDRPDRDLSDGGDLVPYRSVASSAWTAGGIVASAESVARFGDAVLRGVALGRNGRKEMTAFVPAEGPYSAYGLGLGKVHSTRVTDDMWGAVGNFPGFGGTLAHLPSRGVTVVVLANQDDAMRLTADLAERLLEQATATSKAG